MMVPLLLRHEPAWPRTVLLIGLGAASLTRFLYKHRPHAAQTIVEIEPAVIHAAREHFKLPPRVRGCASRLPTASTSSHTPIASST
jgi:spermidine synthase